MRKFLLTSSRFAGQVELIYNDEFLLSVIDLSQAVMDVPTIVRLKSVVPATVDLLIEGKSFSSETTIIEADIEVTFEMFWIKYDKKINKARCIPIWQKLKKADQVKAYYGIGSYDKFLKKNNWREKADPEKYLRNQSWENEYK